MAEQNNILAAVSYLFGWVSGLVVFLIAGEDRFAKFHALQSILFNIAFFVVTIVLMGVSIVLGIVLGIAAAALNLGALAAIVMLLPYGLILIYLLAMLVMVLWAMYKAFTGERYHMPIIGGLADKYA